MTPRHQVSRAAIELIERFEGYRRKAARLADGRWTIGYGHTQTAREGAEVSEADAEALLLYDLRPVAAAVNELIYTPLTQNQFDALAAFAYNVGVDNFRRSSVLRRVNEGALIQAACALEMWRKADFEGERIVVDALVRRRAAEKALFLTPADGWIPAPSPILRPRVDYDVGHTLPKSPTELETSLTGDVAEAHRPVEAEESAAPASQAAAEAVSARLSAILPDAAAPGVAEADAGLDLALPPPAAKEEPALTLESVVPASEAAPAAPAEPEAKPAYFAAAEAGAAVFAPILMAALAETPAVEPAQVEEAKPEPSAEPETHAPPAEAAPEPAGEGEDFNTRYAIPEDIGQPISLSRRIVWREAPMETEAGRLLDGHRRASPLLLAALFLFGLAVFAAGIVWGFHSKGAGAMGWVLGSIGIIFVVCSIYVYLERLGRED